MDDWWTVATARGARLTERADGMNCRALIAGLPLIAMEMLIAKAPRTVGGPLYGKIRRCS